MSREKNDLIKYCNCATCGRRLLGVSATNLALARCLGADNQERVGGTIRSHFLVREVEVPHDKPYCSECLSVKRPKAGQSKRYDYPPDERDPTNDEEDTR